MESLHSELPPVLRPLGLHGDKWREPKRVQPQNWLAPQTLWVSPIAQSVKNLPAVQDTRILSLDREDPLKKEMATLPVFLCQLQIGTRALPMTEKQRHLPPASTEFEPHAAIAVDLQQPLREFRVE